MKVRARAACVAVLALLLAPACKKKESQTTPTEPTLTRSTDTFNGTVPVGGSASNNFTVANAGQVDVTLTAAAPPSDVSMGLAVGVSSDAGCTALAGATTNTSAGSSPQLVGKISPGTLCVKISDNGTQRATVTYTVTVLHP